MSDNEFIKKTKGKIMKKLTINELPFKVGDIVETEEEGKIRITGILDTSHGPQVYYTHIEYYHNNCIDDKTWYLGNLDAKSLINKIIKIVEITERMKFYYDFDKKEEKKETVDLLLKVDLPEGHYWS
jgi:hypothetical protein